MQKQLWNHFELNLNKHWKYALKLSQHYLLLIDPLTC